MGVRERAVSVTATLPDAGGVDVETKSEAWSPPPTASTRLLRVVCEVNSGDCRWNERVAGTRDKVAS